MHFIGGQMFISHNEEFRGEVAPYLSSKKHVHCRRLGIIQRGPSGSEGHVICPLFLFFVHDTRLVAILFSSKVTNQPSSLVLYTIYRFSKSRECIYCTELAALQFVLTCRAQNALPFGQQIKLALLNTVIGSLETKHLIKCVAHILYLSCTVKAIIVFANQYKLRLTDFNNYAKTVYRIVNTNKTHLKPTHMIIVSAQCSGEVFCFLHEGWLNYCKYKSNDYYRFSIYLQYLMSEFYKKG